MPQIEQKFERWDEEIHHPRERCEGTSQTKGQCPFLKIEGSQYCMRHGGSHVVRKQQKEALRNYRLGKWKARVGEFADSEGIKSLREEIGILRVILEEMMNQCKDATELLLFSARMSGLVMQIERLVVSCDKMEGKMGLLLNKDSVLQLASEFVEIINNEITDATVVERISMKMMQATLRIQNPVVNAPATGGGQLALR